MSKHGNWPMLALLVVLLAGGVTCAHARRLALVVGNDSYQSAAPLQNARSDARAVAHALERAGFSVTLKEDLTLKALKEALRGFKEQLSGGDEAVFYYSGHGVQFEGTNYLIPVDLVPQSQQQVADESVPLQRVLDDLREQKTRFALAIVDACRDNPFKGTGRAIGGRGLAPVTAATGQMVLYSAGAGQEALDHLGPNDSDPNGVFTRVLIREISKPGVAVDQMLKSVREQVVRLARGVDHEQVPALYDQSLGDFYFVPTRTGNATDTTTGQAAAAASAASLQSYAQLGSARSAQARQKIEQDLWERLRQGLPHVVFYSFGQPKEGAAPSAARPVWGFTPASATSDGRNGTVTVTLGELTAGHYVVADSDIWDYRVDCTQQQFVPVRRVHLGAVTYFAEAQRKAETLNFVSKPNLSEKLVEQVLCELPLRITPIWAVPDVEWTDLSQREKAALQIRWSDPKRPNERYVFHRVQLAEPDYDGSEFYFNWLVVNCTTHEVHATVSFEALRSGDITGLVMGTTWAPANQGSPAANAYVLLCEQP